MKLKYPALLALLFSVPSVFAQVPSVVINEVDADTPVPMLPSCLNYMMAE